MAKQFEAVLGVIYIRDDKSKEFRPASTYAWASEKPPDPFKSGEGLNGQAAKNKTVMIITDIPEDYIKIASSLGEGSPRNLILLPLMLNKDPVGLLEMACFKTFDDEMEWTCKNLGRMIANSIVTRMKAGKEKK
jgi:hypothetical protein